MPMEIIHPQMRIGSIDQQTLGALYVKLAGFDLISTRIGFK
jgi:hypothetical protein